MEHVRAAQLDTLALALVDENPHLAAAYRTSAAGIREHIEKVQRAAARRARRARVRRMVGRVLSGIVTAFAFGLWFAACLLLGFLFAAAALGMT